MGFFNKNPTKIGGIWWDFYLKIRLILFLVGFGGISAFLQKSHLFYMGISLKNPTKKSHHPTGKKKALLACVCLKCARKFSLFPLRGENVLKSGGENRWIKMWFKIQAQKPTFCVRVIILSIFPS